MDKSVFSRIVLESEKLKQRASELEFRRYLYPEVKRVPEQFFVGIYGMRGIGKTTLLLQLASENPDSLYFSADWLHVRMTGVYEVVKEGVRQGFRNFFVDEIHSQQDWTYHLKTLYDEGECRVFFTGSSALNLRQGADLSRRTVMYHMKPASFREFLCLKLGKRLPAVSLKSLLDHKKRKTLLSKLAPYSEHLEEYFARGGVLYQEPGELFYKIMRNMLDRCMTHDLMALRDVNINVEQDALQILKLIAWSSPLEVNYARIADSLEISKPTVKSMVFLLQKAGLVRVVEPCAKGHAGIRKEPKILLNIPLRHFLCHETGKTPPVGGLREDFFVQHADPECYPKTERGAKTPDYVKDGTTFEIGGASKARVQGQKVTVVDELSLEPDTIPLFLTGFTY